MRLATKILLFSSILLLWSTGHAQLDDFTHPELNWKTIETEHFFVHYHDGAERTARTVAKVAEDIYEPVTALYNHRPDQKVSFIIKDYDDISNGAAYFYDNRIELFAPSMDFELRGTHNWLRNVVTHEFTHIVQIQTAMKFGRKMPAFYLQWLGYEAERRPDVLYGYPNVIVSYPISGFVVPAWFAEGVAQYNRKELRYDFWDSHRDMILRSYALDSTMLTWDEMGVFGKTSLGNESSYNAGFAFVSYIAKTYGEGKLLEISRDLARLSEVTIDGAIQRAVGKSGKEVYDEWRRAVSADYAARVESVRHDLHEGAPFVKEDDEKVIAPDERQRIETMMRGGLIDQGAHMDPCCRAYATTGFANMYPAYSPDGTKVAYVSTKGADYFILSSLYVYDFATQKETLIQPGVRTAVAWSPDGKKLYYGRIGRDNPHWSLQFDIYSYDLAKEEETRITHGLRAVSPAVAPDGKTLAFVVNKDGTTNLAVSGLDGGNLRLITPYKNGEQVYNPRWSPNGEVIVFDYSYADGRDLATVHPDGSSLQYIVQGPDDARNGVFSADGSRILFSSDRTGIFNLYYYDRTTGQTTQVTNVLGGAFFPTVNAAGDIVYSAYTSGGYKIVRMAATSVSGVDSSAHYVTPAAEEGPAGSQPPPLASIGEVGSSTPQFNWQTLRSYNDKNLPEVAARPYKSIFNSLTFVPFIRVDNYNPKNTALDVIKPGVLVFSNDVLDRTGFLAGVALNKQLERDLFLQFFYRSKIPLLYQLGLEPAASLELYNVTRKSNSTISYGATTLPVDVTYNMLEFDAALRQPVFSQFTSAEFRYAHSRYTGVVETFVNPEDRRLVPGSSDLYLIANTLTLSMDAQAIVPSRTSEINPVGRRIGLRISRELNKFNGDGEYELTSTGLQPKYKTINFTRAELTWREYVPFFFKNHTLTLSLHGGTIFGPPVDDFFDFYAGGLIGMKGYPFYALGGNRMAMAGLAYRFPLLDKIDMRLAHLYFDRLYGALFTDIGDAWTGPLPTLRQFKTDIGAELRLQAFSWYQYPTSIFFGAAYGFDRFDRYIRSRDETVTYGKELRLYFGILFGFDFD